MAAQCISLAWPLLSLPSTLEELKSFGILSFLQPFCRGSRTKHTFTFYTVPVSCENSYCCMLQHWVMRFCTLIDQPINQEYLNDIYSICLQLRPLKLCILEVPGSKLSLEIRYLEVLHSFSLLQYL